MANVSVSTLRDIATRMTNDGHEGKSFDMIKANERFNDLRNEWQQSIAPQLRKAATLFTQGVDASADPGYEKELLEQLGLVSESSRFSSGGFETWLFVPWAQRERDANIKQLMDTMNGNRVDSKYQTLISKGHALHTLLAPIESEYITTSFLERSGFAGSWVTYGG